MPHVTLVLRPGPGWRVTPCAGWPRAAGRSATGTAASSTIPTLGCSSPTQIVCWTAINRYQQRWDESSIVMNPNNNRIYVTFATLNTNILPIYRATVDTAWSKTTLMLVVFASSPSTPPPARPTTAPCTPPAPGVRWPCSTPPCCGARSWWNTTGTMKQRSSKVQA